MSRSRIALTLFGAALAAPAIAATPASSPQPEFVPMRSKSSANLERVEKPLLSQPLGIEARTEMRAVVGPDGRVTLECHDVSHAHSPALPLPVRETK